MFKRETSPTTENKTKKKPNWLQNRFIIIYSQRETEKKVHITSFRAAERWSLKNITKAEIKTKITV